MKNIRQVVIDEEMTGLDMEGGDRMVDIGCVELINGKPTGRTYQTFVNPDGRPMSAIAAEMTGLTDEFLAKQPAISQVAKDIKEFIGDSEIIVFCWSTGTTSPDQDYLNLEMKRAGLEPFGAGQFLNIREWAVKMYDVSKNSLNLMLDHYKIDRTSRGEETGHGALLDATLTAEVYPKLKTDWKKYNEKFKALQRRPPKFKL